MKRYSFFLFLFLVSSVLKLGAQEIPVKKTALESSFFMGGNVGLVLGDVTIVEVSPHVGYYITPRWAIAVGLKYHYYKENQRTYAGLSTGGYSSNIYGGQFFTTYEIIRDMGVYRKEFRKTGFFAQAEYELLSMKDRMIKENSTDNNRILSKNYFAGLGMRQWFGTYKSVYLLMLYNFNYNQNTSPYDSNLIVRVGINF